MFSVFEIILEITEFDSETLPIIQALDKIRFLSLTDKEILGEGDNAKLEIQVCILVTYCLRKYCHLNLHMPVLDA